MEEICVWPVFCDTKGPSSEVISSHRATNLTLSHQGAKHMAVGQKIGTQNRTLVNGNLDYNLRSNSWWIHFDHPRPGRHNVYGRRPSCKTVSPAPGADPRIGHRTGGTCEDPEPQVVCHVVLSKKQRLGVLELDACHFKITEPAEVASRTWTCTDTPLHRLQALTSRYNDRLHTPIHRLHTLMQRYSEFTIFVPIRQLH